MVVVCEYLLNNCTEATFRELKSMVGTTPMARELSIYAWILVEKMRELKAESRLLFTCHAAHVFVIFSLCC